MAKEKAIILIHPSGQEQEFSPGHAARLMGMANNGGWKWKNIQDAAILETLRATAQEDDCGCPGKQQAQNADNDSTVKGSAAKPETRGAGKGSQRARKQDKAPQ